MLEEVNKQYELFLAAINLSKTTLLHSYSLAPLSSRRDMAMLGVIHRSAVGKGPKQLQQFFRLDCSMRHPCGRSTLRRHNRQLESHRRGQFLEVIAKSIFGLINVYNMLPQHIIDHTDVHIFQTELQQLLKDASNSINNWESLFSPRHALHMHPLLKLLNAVVTRNGVTDGYVNDGRIAGNSQLCYGRLNCLMLEALSNNLKQDSSDILNIELLPYTMQTRQCSKKLTNNTNCFLQQLI